MTNDQLSSLIKKQKLTVSSGKSRDYKIRLSLLNELEKQIKLHEVEIFDALNKDLGRSNAASFTAELGPLYHELKYIKSKLRSVFKLKKVHTPVFMKPARSYIQHEPFGQILIISPWNYPFSLSMSPLASAIACGNTVVIKPSEYSSNTSEIIKKIIEKVFPEDHVKVVTGGVKESTTLLESRWDYIFFTGSTQVGRIVAQHAAKYLTPVTLELGGKSPTIISKHANIQVAARRVVFGKYTNSGQTCVAPDYLYVHSSIKNEFIASVKEELNRQFGETPLKSKDYCSMISQRHHQRLVGFIDKENVIVGGAYEDQSCRIEPTLVEQADWNNPVMQDEIFGPILPVLTYNNFDDLLDSFKDKEKPLAAYLFSENSVEQNKFLNNLSAGGTCINDCLMHVANHALPFGGVGQSGMGKYHGGFSLETFTNAKAVVNNPTFIDLPIRYAPISAMKLKLIRLAFSLPF